MLLELSLLPSQGTCLAAAEIDLKQTAREESLSTAWTLPLTLKSQKVLVAVVYSTIWTPPPCQNFQNLVHSQFFSLETSTSTTRSGSLVLQPMLLVTECLKRSGIDSACQRTNPGRPNSWSCHGWCGRHLYNTCKTWCIRPPPSFCRAERAEKQINALQVQSVAIWKGWLLGNEMFHRIINRLVPGLPTWRPRRCMPRMHAPMWPTT